MRVAVTVGKPKADGCQYEQASYKDNSFLHISYTFPAGEKFIRRESLLGGVRNRARTDGAGIEVPAPLAPHMACASLHAEGDYCWRKVMGRVNDVATGWPLS